MFSRGRYAKLRDDFALAVADHEAAMKIAGDKVLAIGRKACSLDEIAVPPRGGAWQDARNTRNTAVIVLRFRDRRLVGLLVTGDIFFRPGLCRWIIVAC